MTRAEFVRATAAHLTDQAKFADAKAGSVLGFTAVLGGGLAVAAQTMLEHAGGLSWGPLTLILVVLSAEAAAVAVTVLHCVSALAPRVPRAQGSMASFPDLAAMTTEDVVSRLMQLDEEEQVRQLALHTAALSRLVQAKFEAVARSVWWLRLVLILSLAVGSLFAMDAVIAGLP